MIFLIMIVASSVSAIHYYHPNSNNHIYAQEQLLNSPVGVKIISPVKGQKLNSKSSISVVYYNTLKSSKKVLYILNTKFFSAYPVLSQPL